MREWPPVEAQPLTEAEVYELLDRGAVGGKMRQGLRHVYGAREQALRGAIPRSVPAHVFFQDQNAVYERDCDEVLERARSLLHTAVDRLIGALHAEAMTNGGAALWDDDDEPDIVPERDRLRRNPAAAAATTVEPQLSATARASLAQERSGPLAAATPDNLPLDAFDPASGFTAVNRSSRLSRGWPLERESPPAMASSAGGLRTALPGGSTPKRRHSSQDSLDETPKRSRRTSYSRTRRHAARSPTHYTPSRPIRDEEGNLLPKQPPVQLKDVKEGECVFPYPDAGRDRFFVLRCTRGQCRPNREQMASIDGVLIFTAYPFRYKRAEKHFSGTGHHIDNENQIFFHYAHEVSDAVQELNMEANKRGKSQSRISAMRNADIDAVHPDAEADTDAAGATAATSTASPSSRPRRTTERSPLASLTSPRHPRSRVSAAAAAANLITRPAAAVSPQTTATTTTARTPPTREGSRSRSPNQARHEEAPPSDPSLLFTIVHDEEKNGLNNREEEREEDKDHGGDERGFTRAGFAAPDDDPDDPNDDDALDSVYAPSSNGPSSLEQDAAAALYAVVGHQQRAAAELGDTTAVYPTRARTGGRRGEPEVLEDVDQ